MKKVIKLFSIFLVLVLLTGCGKKEKDNNDSSNNDAGEVGKVDIIDLNSKSRPYAVVVSNTPVAVKVQTGLNDAYMIYEIPVEGGMSRSLALYKDKDTAKIGTIRSARHDFIDYVMESDAIFVHYGWSIYAEEQIPKLGIDNINGLYHSPFWRENPENLATEHTAYTSLVKCKEFAKKKKYDLTTETEPVLTYSTGDVDLSQQSNSKVANTVEVPYGNIYKVKFTYDSNNKVYKRYVNGKEHIDYVTKEAFTAKNIIVVKLDYHKAPNGYYLEIDNVGSGKGYFITNGYAREITWEKKDRSSQTVYKYTDGSEINVSDGNTYVMLQSNSQKLGIN